MRKVILAALVVLAGCSGETPKDASKPAGYALTLAVTPAEGASLQRVALPAAALIALQRPDAGDVRIFDGQGKVVSLARQPNGTASQTDAVRVPTYPIAGPAAAPGASAVSVTITGPGRDVSVEAVNAAAEATAKFPAAVLFDTRELGDPAAALQLDAELPPGQPVEVTLEASGDLKSWDPMGSKVLFRGDAGKAVLGSARVPLGGQILKGRYVRASWTLAPGVAIRGGTFFTAKELPAAQVVIPAAGASLAGDRDTRFALPPGYPPAALRITDPNAGGVVPVQLYGRGAAEQPWVGLSAATLRGGKPADLDLTGFGFGEYRLEADQRSAGFSAAPKIELLYDQVVLIAAFNGQGPFTLAVGNKAAPSAYFAPGELLGDTPISAELPRAMIAAAAPPTVQLALTGNDGPFTRKKLALWAALLAATAVLAFAAVRLMKASATQPAD